MSAEWNTARVGDCLVAVSVAGKTKVQTHDYKSSGRFPVIDQGQEPIAGWTDDDEAVISSPLPLVVFGDHTRSFKFVDTPFARGADGTQLLRPKADIDPRFFFYACRALDLPARGYNRHFTVLKEKELAYPLDPDEQRSIAAALYLSESDATKQSVLLEALSDLKRAAMRELFMRGLRAESQKGTELGELPQSWEVCRLAEVCSLSTGTTPSTKREDYYRGAIPFIKTADIVNNRISSANTHISDQALSDYSLTLLPAGTVLMAMYGQGKTRGQVALLEVAAATTQNAAAIEANDRLVPSFLWHYLMSIYDDLRGMGALGHVSHLNLGYLRELRVPVPPVEEQREIAAILDAIDSKIGLHRRKREVLEELFKSLLHKLMTGEIPVGQLDLSALTLPAAAA